MGTVLKDAFDVPLGGLRPFDRIVLGRNQVAAAIVEVRFARENAAISEDEAVRVLDKMGREQFPIFEQTSLNVWNLTVTPDRTDQSTQIQKGWILTTEDRTLSVTLMPTSVIVQTVEYERFSTSLAEPLAHALSAYTLVTGSKLIQRIGLRYINRLTDLKATRPLFWAPHIKSPFTGPLEGELAELMEGLHQQAHLRLGQNAAAVIHSGVFLDPAANGAYSFLVDIDVFLEQAIDFDLEHCSNLTRQLNRTAYSLFATVLKDETLDDMATDIVGGRK